MTPGIRAQSGRVRGPAFHAGRAFAAVLVIGGGLLVAGADAASEDQVEAALPPAGHTGYGLCAKAPILPIASFYGQHTDRLGNHYHGWIPPAGPPFFVQCLRGESLVIDQP